MHRMLQTAANPDDIRWLPGARLNVAESALCVRDPDAPAVIWATEEAPDVLHTLSLGELRREAMRFAAALRAAGFSPGAHFCMSAEGGGAVVQPLWLRCFRVTRKEDPHQKRSCEASHVFASWQHNGRDEARDVMAHMV